MTKMRVHELAKELGMEHKHDRVRKRSQQRKSRREYVRKNNSRHVRKNRYRYSPKRKKEQRMTVRQEKIVKQDSPMIVR